MAPFTAFALLQLDDQVAQMSLAEGTIYLRVSRFLAGDIVEVDTPNGAVAVTQAGDYRIDVDPANNAVSVTVRSGAAEAVGNGRIFPITPGHMLQMVSSAVVADIVDAPVPDAWEQWCVARDTAVERALAASAEYVSPDMLGAEDLSQYGAWSSDADYGEVWIPSGVAADWAPYRCGHWAYVGPWGWTWIDDAHWGFAPFHYGRWIKIGLRYEWVPGEKKTHPIYGPAMVGFVGIGPIHVRGGRIAWIPLAPGETYNPWHRATAKYVRDVNAPDTHKVSRGANRAEITSVSEDRFTRALPVSPGVARVDGGEVRRVQSVDATPTRESYLGRASSGEKVATPPAAGERNVITRHELPPDLRPTPPAPVVAANDPTPAAAATATAVPGNVQPVYTGVTSIIMTTPPANNPGRQPPGTHSGGTSSAPPAAAASAPAPAPAEHHQRTEEHHTSSPGRSTEVSSPPAQRSEHHSSPSPAPSSGSSGGGHSGSSGGGGHSGSSSSSSGSSGGGHSSGGGKR